jgi:hypothetical protein
MTETYFADHHGYFELCSAIYRDWITQDSRNQVLFSEPEFLLALSYVLQLHELQVKRDFLGLDQVEQEFALFLEQSIPKDLLVPEEINEYLIHYGMYLTHNAVRVIPSVILPRGATPHEEVQASTSKKRTQTAPIVLESMTGTVDNNWVNQRFSPRVLSDFIDHSLNATVPHYFDDAPRRPCIPAGFPPIAMHRYRIQALANYPPFVQHGTSVAARLQFSGVLLADYISTTETMRLKRRMRPLSYSVLGTQAQLVIARGMNVIDGSPGSCFDYLLSGMIDVTAVQAARAFRYQRLVPIQSTYFQSPEEVDSCIRASSQWVRLQTMDAKRVEVMRAFLAELATSQRLVGIK